MRLGRRRGPRYRAAEVLLRGDRAVVFAWHPFADDPSGFPEVFGTEAAVGAATDEAWIGAAVFEAFERSAEPREQPADKAKPFNRARLQSFGLRTQKALNDGLLSFAVRRHADRLGLSAFDETGKPVGGASTLDLDTDAAALGRAIVASAASIRAG